MAARREDRAAANGDSGYRLLIWRRGEELRTIGYAEPVDALAAAVAYLKAGYQVRLGGELVEHYAGELPGVSWWPSLRDWRLLDGMLRRAIESPGFFHARAESAGRGEAERLAVRISELIARIGRQM